MATRTKDELGKALGCVIYEMLVLLVALSIFRKRQECPLIEGLKWGEPQIATDVILLKCRSLMDFLSPKRNTRGGIGITDFGLRPIALPGEIRAFRRSVNQWSAHLSWQRALRLQTGAAQPIQKDLETRALWLLARARAVVSECLARGITLMEERHRQFYNVFEREYVGMGAGQQMAACAASAEAKL